MKVQFYFLFAVWISWVPYVFAHMGWASRINAPSFLIVFSSAFCGHSPQATKRKLHLAPSQVTCWILKTVKQSTPTCPKDRKGQKEIKLAIWTFMRGVAYLVVATKTTCHPRHILISFHPMCATEHFSYICEITTSSLLRSIMGPVFHSK